MRIKCNACPTDGMCVDSQLTQGRFYNLLGISVSMSNEIFYSVVGNDGIEIQRKADFFSKPLLKKRHRQALLYGGSNLWKKHTQTKELQ